MSKKGSMIVIMEQQRRLNWVPIIAVSAVIMALTISIGSAYAMLSFTGNETPNRFTVVESFNSDLLEPAYTNAALRDNGVTDLTTPLVSDASLVKYYDGVDKVAIPKAAYLQKPGSYYAKNPFVVNTSTNGYEEERDTEEKPDTHAFAGIKVQFQRVHMEGGTSVYKNMTDTEVETLLKYYYIGALATTTTTTTGTNEDGDPVTTTTTTTETTKDTKAGFGDGTNSSLGVGWYQLLGGQYGATTAGKSSGGAMYFVNKKRLTSLAATVYRETPEGQTRDTISATPGTLSETATSDTWGYDVSATSPYATTPLFGTVRYIDTVTPNQIRDLKNMLDPIDEDTGKRTVSDAGGTPGWRMIMSSAVMSSTSDEDVATLMGGASSTTPASGTEWFNGFKTILDNNLNYEDDEGNTHEYRPTTSTGVRVTSNLGKYIKVGAVDATTGVTTSVTLNGGEGVPEATSISGDED